ncbi:NAD(P)/FAD-dependent oxidoreductase [Flavobacterium sp.]|uniref:NAD(P)/FAD-dependent oxidoreductase n=1 Tax=Flavobacterium sp. TaxID=239 RepID=UPI002FDA6907
MIDYLIVGSGLSGIAFAEWALQNGKTIHVFDNKSQNSSVIAGGLYNPVILKRFSEVWKSQEQINLALPFYSALEQKLQCVLDYKIPIFRKLFSVEEQNNWYVASDNPNLKPFIASSILYKDFHGIDAPYGYGEVVQSGYINTSLLVKTYQDYLNRFKFLSEESFDYSQLDISNEFPVYKNVYYKHVVFAEGFGLHANPFFSQLPLDGTKGELVLIKCPELKLDAIIKSSVFILPLGNDLFKVGATYNWQDKSAEPTEAGKQELLTNLKSILNLDFEVVAHLAGVRPTVKDRRPLVGSHPKFTRLHVLNGLGTRGVMLAPFVAKALFESIENKTPLDENLDIRRFKKLKWD